MADMASNARKAYYKQWRERNKERIKEYNNRYWIRRTMREQMQHKEMQKHDGSSKEN